MNNSKFLMVWIGISQWVVSCISSYLPYFGLMWSDHRVLTAMSGHSDGLWVWAGIYVGAWMPIVVPYILLSMGELQGCTPLQQLTLACCTAAQPLVPSRVPIFTGYIYKGPICGVLWKKKKLITLWLLVKFAFKPLSTNQSWAILTHR